MRICAISFVFGARMHAEIQSDGNGNATAGAKEKKKT